MRSCGVILAGVAALAMAACGGSGGSGSGDDVDVEPASVVGETEQGLHLRIDPVGDREVSLRFPVVCGRDDRPGEGSVVSLHRHRLETGVDGDGGFTVDESYVEDGTDGDEEHVEVRIDGDFAEDGTATGTLEVTARWWNGEGEEFSADCESGTVAWTADRPPAEGDDVVAPMATPMALAAAGPDLLAGSGSGEVVRIDADTGEVRRLDGSAPAGPATTEADPNVPPVAVAGGSAAPATEAPIWLGNLAVVADGVWMVDAATGLVSRFELADGARTATIAQPIDSIAAGPDALWTVSTNAFHSGYALDKRDPTTGAVLASTPAERGITAVGPTVWYIDATLAGGRLARVDPTTVALGEPFEVDIPQFGEDPVVTEDRVWWLDTDGLMSIELATGRVGLMDLPSYPDSVAGDATGVWTLHEQEAVARRIEGDRVVRTVDVPDGGWNVAVTTDGAVWLAGSGTTGDDSRVIRLDPAVTAG